MKAITLAFAKAKFERYAALDTAHRKAFQTRLGEWVPRTHPNTYYK